MPLARLLALLLTCLTLMATGATRAAARPYNDDLNAAGLIIEDFVTSGTTVGATREPNEPFHWWVGEGGSVWYYWLVFDGGCYTVDTCGSNFDTVVAVYQAPSYGPFLLNKIASNDDSSTCSTGSRQSSVTVELPRDGFFFIAVAGFGKNDAGEYTLRITRCPAPANDDYDNAQLLSIPGSADGTTLGATREWWGETSPTYYYPAPAQSGSVWFRRPVTDSDCMTVTTEAVGQRVEPHAYYDVPPSSRNIATPIAEGLEQFGTGFNVVYRNWKKYKVNSGYDYRFSCVGHTGGGPFRIDLEGCNPYSLYAMRGDANGDGNVNIADVTAIHNYLLQGTQSIPGRADANCDGTVTAADAMLILYYLRDREEFLYYYGNDNCGGFYFSGLLDPAKKYESELLDRYQVAYLGTHQWSRRLAYDPVVVGESIPDYVPVGLYYFGGVQLTTRGSIFAAWAAMVAFWIALGGLVAWQFRRDWLRRAEASRQA